MLNGLVNQMNPNYNLGLDSFDYFPMRIRNWNSFFTVCAHVVNQLMAGAAASPETCGPSDDRIMKSGRLRSFVPNNNNSHVTVSIVILFIYCNLVVYLKP